MCIAALCAIYFKANYHIYIHRVIRGLGIIMKMMMNVAQQYGFFIFRTKTLHLQYIVFFIYFVYKCNTCVRALIAFMCVVQCLLAHIRWINLRAQYFREEFQYILRIFVCNEMLLCWAMELQVDLCAVYTFYVQLSNLHFENKMHL